MFKQFNFKIFIDLRNAKNCRKKLKSSQRIDCTLHV